jgi:hypothetical protein
MAIIPFPHSLRVPNHLAPLLGETQQHLLQISQELEAVGTSPGHCVAGPDLKLVRLVLETSYVAGRQTRSSGL